jgi:hypothetical protein
MTRRIARTSLHVWPLAGTPSGEGLRGDHAARGWTARRLRATRRAPYAWADPMDVVGCAGGRIALSLGEQWDTVIDSGLFLSDHNVRHLLSALLGAPRASPFSSLRTTPVLETGAASGRAEALAAYFVEGPSADEHLVPTLGTAVVPHMIDLRPPTPAPGPCSAELSLARTRVGIVSSL